MYITYRECTLSIRAWREGIGRLIQETTAEVEALLLNKEFDLSLDRFLPDDWNHLERGYSWMDNTEYANNDLLLEAYLEEGKLVTYGPDGEPMVVASYAWALLDKIQQVTRHLALLCFLMPGGVPRETEFHQHKIRNSNTGRTVFFWLGDLWMVI
jgi:hypothetical protein